MTSKCFVPNCKNTVGISFPDDEEQKQKWLEALEISDLVPTSTSFLCSDHFEDADKVFESAGLTLKKSQTANDKNNSENEAEKFSDQNDTAEEPSNDESRDENERGILESSSEIQEETKVKSEPPEVIMFDVDLKTCRLCMREDINLLNIFEEEVVENVPIVVSILACVHPIEITVDDSLPKHVCSTCVETLAMCFKFRSICLKNDKSQRQKYDSLAESRGLKRKAFQVPTRTVKKLREDSEESEDENELKQVQSEQKKSDIDAKFDKVEEELRRVLEGTLSEEQANSENIIIHIENDEEASEPVPPSTTSRRVIIPGDAKDDLSLPKSLKSRPGKPADRSSFRSPVGMYDGVSISYAFDTKFCSVDGYLFEYRLKIGDRREMRCLTPDCHASAYQWKTRDGSFSKEVAVVKPHNHKKLTNVERKKQVFHYVMRKKVQSDKTINFKGIYQEVCDYDPQMKELVPLRDIINIICRNPFVQTAPTAASFDRLYDDVDKERFEKFQFTFGGEQFFQQKFSSDDDGGAKAVVFANEKFVAEVSDSELMYVDASFKIDTDEDFDYQLVTVLVLVEDNYYPILYALIDRKSQDIFKKIFEYLHDTLAPDLRPDEIVTDYDADLYYALGETYLDSSIGGSVFYYAKNIYKKICASDLAKDLETNSNIRTIYHMLVMLPLLPVNTIADGLANIEMQAKGLGLESLFDHVRSEWVGKVTPDLFCVHRLENRINESVMAPFKKLRDLLTLSKGKLQKKNLTVVSVLSKMLDLEHFTRTMFEAPSKKAFIRNLSCSQKRNVLRAWQYIESHPKINVNSFFSKVVGYIKSMENQLWIWGYYRCEGEPDEELIDATNFSIVSSNVEIADRDEVDEEADGEASPVVMEAVIDENGAVGFVVQDGA